MSRYSSTWLEVWAEISIPSSAIAAIALGFTPWVSMPALYTSARFPAKWRRYPSANWLRQLLPVQSTRIFFAFSISAAASTRCAGRRGCGNLYESIRLPLRGYATRILCQASRGLVLQHEMAAIEIQAIAANGVALVLHFHFGIRYAELLFGKRNDMEQLSGFQPVLVVVCIPQLEIDHLLLADHATAVDEMLRRRPYFGDVKMFR